MTTAALTPGLKRHLDELFTRTYVSAATYVFESQPYTVEEDAELLELLGALKTQDRDHATLLANLLRQYGEVPEPGVFPYWHRDLNYLTVPYMTAFVVESLQTDLEAIDRALAATPDDLDTIRAALGVMRGERAAHLETLAPLAVTAQEREDAAYAAGSKAIRDTREARIAEQKAAEAARKEAERKKKAEAKAKADAEAAAKAAPAAADPTAGMPDPNEPGISSKEKAKRTMMIKRAQKKAAEAAAAGGAAAAPAAADPTAGMPDPNEPGISSKEKAKRTMMIKRAQKKAAEAAGAGGAAAAPAAAPSKSLDEVLAAMPDPDEPGITGKEKAKRAVMRNRAKKKFEADQAAGGAAAAAPAPAAAANAPAAAPSKSLDEILAAMPDPDEAGITGKEKAKRAVMRNRAKKKWEADQAAAGDAAAPDTAAAAAAPAAAPSKSLDEILAAMPDPDEAGISGKEKAKRTVMRNRAKKKFEAENG